MLVSVVVPVYNLGHIARQAVQSLVTQTHQDLEIILVDDGSTDDSGDICDALAERDDRIRVIHQENKGLSGALNTGFEAAKGEAFIILSADDLLKPSAIGKMAATMEQSGADVVNVDMEVNGQHVHTRPLDLDALKRANCHGYAALFRPWIFQQAGGFKTTMNPSWEDWEFWLNAAKLGARAHRIPEPLFIYRPSAVGRDAEAQGKDWLLWGKLHGYHQDLFGEGRGVVAFVIPLYDHERWVRGAIQSALGQIYPHVEVIVVDDGSPGDVEEAVEGLPVYLLRQNNRGLSVARNVGIGVALEELGAEYFVCLDADDEVDPLFVERCLGAMTDRHYVYSDVQFIGDANHQFEVKDWNCDLLWRQHLHSCTFVAPMAMWLDVLKARGYGYDPAMREGFEDWEFALACVEAGWCGYRLREPLFRYRYHANGSMRTEALKKKDQLGRYVRSKHGRSQLMAGCRGCGGPGRHTAPRSNPKGAGNPGTAEPIEVFYTGSKKGTMTKIGRNGTIYRYSANKRQFTAFAHDQHLFQGPFRIRPLAPQPPEPPERELRRVVERPQPPPAQRPPQTSMGPPAPPPAPTPAQIDEGIRQAVEAMSKVHMGDDLTQLPYVGAKRANALVRAGLSKFGDIAQAHPTALARILTLRLETAEEIAHAAAAMAM